MKINEQWRMLGANTKPNLMEHVNITVKYFNMIDSLLESL